MYTQTILKSQSHRGARCTHEMSGKVRANVENLSRGYVRKLHRRNYSCASGARECNASAAATASARS